MNVFFVSSLVFLGLSIVSFFLIVFTDDNILLKFTIAFCLIISVIFAVIWEGTTPSEILYNEKLEAVKRAEKDLQKFLIEYPQFKQ